MLKRLRFISILIVILLILQACYSTYQIPIDKKTDSQVPKSIKVITKDGKTFELISYTINENVLIGKNQDGDRIEIPKENIKTVTGKKPNKLFIAGIIIGFGTFLFVWYSFQKFSEIGI